MPATTLPAQPLARTSLAEAAYERLLEAILAGRLPRGTELSEVALAAEFQVSRTPIHEAIRRLAADGLIHITASRTAHVAEFARGDVIEIYEMRTCLETAAAARAADRMTETDLNVLHTAADALRDVNVRGWSTRAHQFDALFHDRIAAACGNARLQTEIRKYRHLVRAFCRMSGNSENLQAAYAEHLVILEALTARSSAAAARAMSAHIASRLDAVLHELPAE